MNPPSSSAQNRHGFESSSSIANGFSSAEDKSELSLDVDDAEPEMAQDGDGDDYASPMGGVKHYVQGVLQGQQAYLITNLLRGESLTLFQPQMVWTIGRNRQAAFPFTDKKLSRRHAVIQYVPQKGFYLIDLNSMNGSFVNDGQVQQRQLLQDADRVHIGRICFTFFVSHLYRQLEEMHPEVLARLNALDTRSAPLPTELVLKNDLMPEDEEDTIISFR